MLTLETKYIAVSQRARENIWIRRLLNKHLSNNPVKEMKMLGDNKTKLTLMRDLTSQNQIKQIDIIYYHIHGYVKDGELAIDWNSNSNMLTDSLRKALPVGLFKEIE